MTVDNGIRILAGSMVLISLLLHIFHSQWWLLLAAFVGVNLIQSALTGFCPPTIVLKKLGCTTCCDAEKKHNGDL